MNIPQAFQLRVDPVRFEHGLDAADFLASHFVGNGRYSVDESWGPEGLLYLAESSWALMDAYAITHEERYIDAVRSILAELKRIQKASGGWAIELGKSGLRFKVTEDERKDSAEKEDPPTTASFLRTIQEYQTITGDHAYRDMGARAFRYLADMWDPEVGTFVDPTKRKLLDLRSNPSSYHLFFLIGVSAWKAESPELAERIYPHVLNFVKRTFESFDINTMPLICALHTAVLLDHCSDEYIRSVIKPRIDANLVNNDTFMIPSVPGGYGHRDGSRGIVTNEVHMRSVCGIAIAMKQFDLATGTTTYRDSEKYNNIAKWIDGMRGDKFFYEFESLPDRKRWGYGSPGQYLPCWWILGRV